MNVISDRGLSSGSAHTALIMLPGAYMHAQDFVTHGFVDAVRRTGQPIDILAVETGMETYLDGSVVGRLHDEVIGPAAAAGVRRFWLAGISLGGLGALLYAKAHGDAVAGLLLLSPFIGTRGTIAQVVRAGGFGAWQPPADSSANGELRLLKWLKAYTPADPALPDIYLGYGRDDRFATSYRLLEAILPAERVETATGGHDWETWTGLWEQLLQKVIPTC